MKVVVAGATGALAAALIPRLAHAGHEVVGLSRSPSAKAELARLGADLDVVDVLDRDRLRDVVTAARPDVVIHAAKAIPKRGPLTFRDMRMTNRLHDEGTRNLIDAAIAGGASRFIAESIVFVYGYGDLGPAMIGEDRPPPTQLPRPRLREEVNGVVAMERQTRSACDRLDGIILRFGLFYGPRAGTDGIARRLRRRALPLPGGGTGVWPLIYIDDAADALLCALTTGRPGEAYNIVDDEPVRLREFIDEVARVATTPPAWSLPKAFTRLGAGYFTEVASTVMHVSNDKAKIELGWSPAHPTYRDGLADWATNATTAARRAA